jgi:hypothetical protein
MKRFKVVATIFCLSLAALAFSSGVKADAWNKKTVVTFSQPIEVPGGIVLPAGTYVFKLLDSASNRHIVQIFDPDQTHIHATILAIPNWRLDVTDKTVITFWETPAGDPHAIRAWFYPGDNFGQEFVYPKRRAAELAKKTDSPSLPMPTELESETTEPPKSVNDEPVAELKQDPLTEVKPAGEEVEAPQATTPPSEQQKETAEAPEPMEQLPQTASSLPILGLIGLLSLGAGLALMGILKRTS